MLIQKQTTKHTHTLFNIGLLLRTNFFQTLYVDRAGTTNLHGLIPVWTTLTFIQVTVVCCHDLLVSSSSCVFCGFFWSCTVLGWYFCLVDFIRTWLSFWHFWTDLFQTWYAYRHNLTPQSGHWPWLWLRVIGLQESWNLCNHSIVKWHEVTQIFGVVDCVKEITAKKSCKYDESGSFGYFLLFWCVDFVRVTWMYVIRTRCVFCLFDFQLTKMKSVMPVMNARLLPKDRLHKLSLDG